MTKAESRENVKKPDGNAKQDEAGRGRSVTKNQPSASPEPQPAQSERPEEAVKSH
jgi:hypothetical protein